jgi:hypothetical protein
VLDHFALADYRNNAPRVKVCSCDFPLTHSLSVAIKNDRSVLGERECERGGCCCRETIVGVGRFHKDTRRKMQNLSRQSTFYIRRGESKRAPVSPLAKVVFLSFARDAIDRNHAFEKLVLCNRFVRCVRVESSALSIVGDRALFFQPLMSFFLEL